MKIKTCLASIAFAFLCMALSSCETENERTAVSDLSSLTGLLTFQQLDDIYNSSNPGSALKELGYSAGASCWYYYDSFGLDHYPFNIRYEVKVYSKSITHYIGLLNEPLTPKIIQKVVDEFSDFNQYDITVATGQTNRTIESTMAFYSLSDASNYFMSNMKKGYTELKITTWNTEYCIFCIYNDNYVTDPDNSSYGCPYTLHYYIKHK